MKKAIFLAIVLGLVFWTDKTGADIICFNNGSIMEGIIIRDTNRILEVEASLGARVTFAKSDIAYVEKWDEEKNRALKEEWLVLKEERERARRAQAIFEAEQKNKGLVKYKGEWVLKAQRDSLKREEYIRDILKRKIKRGEIIQPGRKGRTELACALLAKGNWYNRQSEHFIIYYEDITQAKAVGAKAEYYYEKIAYDLGYTKEINWLDKCEVFIIPDEEKWQEYIQTFVKKFDHAGGFVPQTGEKEICLRGISTAYLSVGFPHELTHLIFNDFARGEDIPLWLNEGLAIYESGNIGYADTMLHDSVGEGEHIPIEELVELKRYPRNEKKLELYYAQAQSVVGFLISQHGREKFSHFCKLLISGQSFESALSLTYSDKYSDPDKFERAWIKHVL